MSEQLYPQVTLVVYQFGQFNSLLLNETNLIMMAEEIAKQYKKYNINLKLERPDGIGSGPQSSLWAQISLAVSLKEFILIPIIISNFFKEVFKKWVINTSNKTRPELILYFHSSHDEAISHEVNGMASSLLIVLEKSLATLNQKYPVYSYKPQITISSKSTSYTIDVDLKSEHLTKFKIARILNHLNNINDSSNEHHRLTFTNNIFLKHVISRQKYDGMGWETEGQRKTLYSLVSSSYVDI